MNVQHPMDQPAMYQITVQGKLDEAWAGYFDTLEILPQPGNQTVLTGPLPDQAALQGTLQKLYSLGLPLVSVEKLCK